MFEADRNLGTHRWPVVRLRAGSRSEVTLLSRQFFCLGTHWNGITVPCCGDDCRLCEMLPLRGLFFVAVMCESRVSILELGAQSASHFEQHAKMMHGGMRPGLVFVVGRRGAKQPVYSEVIREQSGCVEVSALELGHHAMTLFKFPCPNPGDDVATYEKRCRAIAKVRCDRAFDLLTASVGN